MSISQDQNKSPRTIMECSKAKQNLCHGWVLPQELTLEIFHRLPIKSLVRSMLVSTHWNSLISSPTFAKSYLHFLITNQRAKPKTLFFQPNHRFSLLNTNEYDEFDYDFERIMGYDSDLDFLYDDLHDYESDFILLDSPSPKASRNCKEDFCDILLGSCDGLICFFRPCLELFYVWNPTTNDSENIDFPYDYVADVGVMAESWFGFVPSIDDYIIVLFTKLSQHIRIHVYSLKNYEWRELDGSMISHVNWNTVLAPAPKAAFMNDALHYVVRNQAERMCKFDQMLVFDLVQEKVEIVQVVKKGEEVDDNVIIVQASLVVMDDKMFYWQLFKTDTHNFAPVWLDLWRLEQYGKWDSWNKIYRINLCPRGEFWKINRVMGFLSTRKVVIRDCHCGRVEIIDTSKEQEPLNYKRSLSGNYRFGSMVNYVRSIVSPFM